MASRFPSLIDLFISNKPVDKTSKRYIKLTKTIPKIAGQAVYVYSVEKRKPIYTYGWEKLLGYKDDEIGLRTLLNSTHERYSKFTRVVLEKSLRFLLKQKDKHEEYSLTLEFIKKHKNGGSIPVIASIGVFKAKNGKIAEVIGVFTLAKNLYFSEVMYYAAYGPKSSQFEETLNEVLYKHYAISRKEKDALNLAAKGYAFKEIALELNVSQSAIEKRIIPMYKRFNVKSLSHLVSFAYENHILP